MCQSTLLLVSLALLVVRSAQQQDLPSIQLLSPVADQQLARAQDLVVKYAIADDGHACRVVLVINGRVVGTHEGCKLSVLVPEYELVLGSNLVEVIRQGDDYYNYEEQEASVTFAVVEPKQWPSVPSGGSRGASDAREACSQHDAACSRGACIHQVSDMCILYEDEWAREKGAIPRILHWVWVGGGGDIPAKFHPMMESWRRLHPNWQAVVWTDEKVTWELRNQALMLQADTYAELSDIVRLEVVERFGGVYVDTDFQALQPLDTLLSGLEFFVGAEKDPDILAWGKGEGEIWVCPSLFGAVEGHSIMRMLIDGLPAQVSENVGQDPNHKTGPFYWTNAYAGARACMEAEVGSCDAEALLQLNPPDYRAAAAALLHRYVSLGTAKVFPRQVFYPYGWWEQEKRGLDFPAAYAVHHWQKNWGGGWKQ